MNKRLVLTILLACFASATYAAGIYKWVDEKGAVHYGDIVPEKYKHTATEETELEDVAPPIDEAEAIQKRERAKAVLERPPLKDKPASNPTPDAADSGTNDASSKEACEQQWKQYIDSLECFAPYRNALGGIKAEAYNYCTEVAKPGLCD